MINTDRQFHANIFQRSPSVSSLSRLAEEDDDLKTTKRSLSCENLLHKTRTCDSGTGDSVAELPIQPVNYVRVPIYGHPMVAYMANRFDFDMNLVLDYQRRQEQTQLVCASTSTLEANSFPMKSKRSPFSKLFKSSKPTPGTPIIRIHLTDKSSNQNSH